MMTSGFDLDDLVLAYRKAKVDLYYSNDRRVLALLKYEKKLKKNLQSLLDRINGDNDSWAKSPLFLGGYTVAPKGMKDPRKDSERDANTLNASPAKNWDSITASGKRPTAEFRLVSQCSIDFHVLSALWMGHVGPKLEASLGKAAKGNRLRLTQKREYNWFAVGSFQPYLHAYRSWQDQGLDAMTDALEKDKSVVGVTADVTGFFHNLDPSFLQNKEFLSLVAPQGLTQQEWVLHDLFSSAVIAWSGSVAKHLSIDGGHCGLPVGLPASGLVANLALANFDRMIVRELKPLYYGRYVDDVILVLEGGQNFCSAREVWEWIEARSGGSIKGSKPQTSNKSDEQDEMPGLVMEYIDSSLEQSSIKFENGKNKVWLLEGETGKTLVASIRESIRARTSEWRGLPVLPEDPKEIGPLFVKATQKNGDPADSLRKADGLSINRANFALKLADVEAYARDLEPAAWKEHRQEFYRVMQDHMLVLPNFFDIAQYFPRVLRVAVVNADWDDLVKLLEAVGRIFRQVRRGCTVRIAALDTDRDRMREVLGTWGKQLLYLIEETIVTSTSSSLPKSYLDGHAKITRLLNGSLLRQPSRQLYRSLLLRDLADHPFRSLLLPEEIRPPGVSTLKTFSIRNPISSRYPPLPRKLGLHLRSLANVLWEQSIFAASNGKKPNSIQKWDLARMPGLCFPTRPLTVGEIFTATRVMNSSETEDNPSDIAKWLLATRGFAAAEWAESFVRSDGGPFGGTTISLPREQRSTPGGKVRIALGMVETKRSSLDAALHRKPDLSRQRHATLSRFFNDVIRRPAKEIDYLLLPELSIPPQWYLRFADKLKRRGISLIVGVEYLHREPNQVHNQIWASLVHSGLGFNTSAIYRQDKQQPAQGEEANLKSQRNLELVPERITVAPPRFKHGDFIFAVLVCSEMTNIAYRTALRGKVDALFLPQWNQDLHTFEALVESAALDIHAYVAQANNRTYGDSRIRAPRMKEYERDVVRVKGGMHDYFVVGEIDYGELRAFQSQYRAQSDDFKPLPDGFEEDFDKVNRYRAPGEREISS